MSDDLRHAGCGFPNGAVDNARVFSLPSPYLLMLSTEARYHHDAAVAAGKRILWRSIPRIGKRPAELGWSPARFVAETINLTDAPSQPIRDFVWANELDLRDERGDGADDFADLDQRYALIGGWAYSVVTLLRQWSPSIRIHWPAWTPDHQALDYLGRWKSAAALTDVVDFHAYDSLANIERQYTAYRRAFPGKLLSLTEWHCKGDVEEERRVLQWLAETMDDDPLFESAYFFIWRWWGHPGWWSDAWDIEHSPDRHDLFMHPPAVTRVPDPELPTEPETPTMPDLPRGIDVASYQGYPDWAAVAASGVRFAITKATESVDYVNPTLAHNWAGIRANGIIRGAYHYARLERGNAAHDEAEYFVAAVERAGGLQTGDLLALDLEPTVTVPGAGAWALAWLRRVEQLVGFKPLVYTGPWVVAQQGLAAHPELGQYGLWLASYQASMPPAPAPWEIVAFWQHGSTGRIPGIVGDVDVNVFNGDAERIPLYGKPGAVEPPSYSVGDGIRAAMTANGDVPATDEQFVSPQWSEAYGRSGARYVWVGSLGRVIRYDPAA